MGITRDFDFGQYAECIWKVKEDKYMDEKNYQDMTPTELRNAIAEYQRQNTPSGPQHPDAPGCEKLPDDVRDIAATLYGQEILRKPADKVTGSDKEFIRAGILAWQKQNQ